MANKNKVYVYSTLTSDMEYRVHAQGGADMPSVEASVLIKGGTNLPDKRLVTPRGVVTAIDEDAMSWLQDNEVFRLHVSNGFITVSEHEMDAEKVSVDMEGRDQSAPLEEPDFEKGQGPVGSGKDEKPAPAPKGNSRRA